MLFALINARQKWLKEDGILVPNQAKIFMAGINCPSLVSDLVPNIEYGANLSAIGNLTRNQMHVLRLEDSDVVTEPFPVRNYNLATVAAEKVNIDTEFRLVMKQTKNLTGFAFWFEVSSTQGPIVTYIACKPINSLGTVCCLVPTTIAHP